MQSSRPAQLRDNPARLSTDLGSLLPLGVVAAEMRECGEHADLWAAEAEQVQRAVPKRVREFAAGRACARRALRELGVADSVLLAAPDRAPIWPDAIVGSITHTAGFCAAAVAPRTLLAAIGIDSEQVGGVSLDMWATICGAEETLWCHSLAGERQPFATALLFSAKEAFYKCQYPLTREWLDFHDLHVAVSGWSDERGQFSVQPTRSLAMDRYTRWPVTGQFMFRSGVVLTAVALATPQ